LGYLSRGADIVVLAGSLPRDVPAEYYAVLAQKLARPDLRIVVDAPGSALREALLAEPWLVSPNTREAEDVVGNEDAAAGAAMLCHMGAGNALVHDERGCVASLTGDGGTRTLLARVDAMTEVVSTVGSGDAFLAGYLAGVYVGASEEDALREAVACGAASTQLLGAGVLAPGDVEAIARQVTVHEVAAGA
ncbi:MAG: 1-phosphofructokinase family hexose kinase, partial [Thermoleophilia bacterium]|nr:1-phosphofructokinase family hexose kinase [Thermoleophilia bacterium]